MPKICFECLAKFYLLPMNSEKGNCKLCKKKKVPVANLKPEHLKRMLGAPPITKTSSAKGKGRRLQQWAQDQIGKITGFEYGKDKPIRSREMGQSGVDVVLDDRVLKIFPFSLECKNTESWSIPAFIRQAKENQIENTDWLVILKKNGHEEIVVIDALAFFKLVTCKIRYTQLKKVYTELKK